MMITPLILGSGRAGHAIAKSLSCLTFSNSKLEIQLPVWIKRGTPLASVRKAYSNPILCIANPHGLHADSIVEADQAGFDAILCEKPACVNLTQLQKLREIKTPTAILHVYRQMWGIQTLKQLLDENKFGQLISIEGRYWQASTAERSLIKEEKPHTKSWKDDLYLSGEYDTYLDVGTHWIDAVSFLYGQTPKQIQGWRSYINANASHRDSHVQVAIDFPKGGRALGSISKSFHGATNHFEMNVIGSKMSATWEFLRPDELFIGEGRDRRVITRKTTELGSKQPPHHGMGWLEGYIEIASRLLDTVYNGTSSQYPDLRRNLDVIEAMLRTSWQDSST